MLKRNYYAFLVLFLSACGTLPVITPLPTLAATVTTIPTNTVPPVSTLTPVPVEATPSPLPPTPTFPSVFTPDAAQVEHWQEYQMELAKYVLSNWGGIFPDYERALCEWDILGRSNQGIYVWAVCSVTGAIGESPAVIYLEPNGSVREIKVVWPSFSWDADIQQLFPIDIQEKIHQYKSVSPFSGRPFEMRQRLEYRMTHFGEPPLIVLSAIPLPTQTPPPPTMPPMITPDAAQVERWKEYQTELAKTIFHFESPEHVLCEWEILGQSGQEVYIWAVCGGGPGGNPGASVPAVIHLDVNGSIQSVETPGTNWSSNILKMFPANVREKFDIYNFGKAEEMAKHLELRQTHPEEPPLIVLSTTPMP